MGGRRVFKNKAFSSFARKSRVSDAALIEAIDKADAGLAYAELGGGLVKLAIPRPSEGQRGGYRTIVAYRARDRAVFLYGFPKNVKGNINDDDLKDFKDYAKLLLGYGDAQLDLAVRSGVLVEIVEEEGKG